ncbi:MAG: hypothetical protein ACOYON_08890 [Fimbriimonas sp.]
MSQTLELPLFGLDDVFPDVLFIISHPSTGRFGCFCHDGVHGLACFSSEVGAIRFSEHIDLSGMQTLEVTFDEAREIAKGRPLPVVSLMLLDQIDDPKIHFVR